MRASSDELTKNRLDDSSTEDAVQHIKVNGYIILENVLPQELITTLHEEYMALFKRYLEDPDDTFGHNHYRLYLPFRQPFIDERIITNPFAIPILKALLGEKMRCHYFASNTCMPGSDHQPVHSDIYPLFPEAQIAPPPYIIVLNVPLVDFTEEQVPLKSGRVAHI